LILTLPSYYKTVGNAISPRKREYYLGLTQKYKDDTRLINFDTGEFREFYPTVNLDRREKKTEAKESNPNSYAHRFESIFGEDAYFYTILGADLYPSWGQHPAIFDRAKMDNFKRCAKTKIDGSFTGIFELSAYSGCHLHFLSSKQDSKASEKYFKAETPVYDFFGAVQYLSKPVINPKDKGTESYEIMTGMYLDASLKRKEAYSLGQTAHKRLPNRNLFRFREG
jgi:hypothetical protein